MANKVIAVVLMFIVVVAAQQVQNAAAQDQDDNFQACYEECNHQCDKKGHGGSFCEMKCDADCGAKEAAAKLGMNVGH